jgi:hypothetical protein
VTYVNSNIHNEITPLISYSVTFGQTGVGSDYTGTVLTVDSTNYKQPDLPVTLYWQADSSHTYAYVPTLSVDSGTRYTWSSITGASSPQSGTLTATSDNSITANYVKQYQITFDTSGLDDTATGTIVSLPAFGYIPDFSMPYNAWFDSGSTLNSANFTYSQIVASTTSGKQVYLTGVSPTSISSLTGPSTITGSYKTQYQVTFSASPSTGGTIAPTGFNSWQDIGAIAISATANSGYQFTG